MMVEYLRKVVRKNRIIELAVATAMGFAGVAALAGPVGADPPLAVITADPSQHLNADGSVQIAGNYTCRGGQGKLFGSSWLEQVDSATEHRAFSTTEKWPDMLTCDGTERRYAFTLPTPEYFPFRLGPATLLIIWDIYTTDGNIDRAEVDQVTVTLVR
ncbi:DUF6299 family protein [Nocardia altamirensis]|uniref:DUF6299 family protein n=1 Tax=Nocardia altamirensis TaxID=472158 RepID=UPI00084021F0|nr:DUF6299 family protein [Nocardia altamirensis]